MKKAVLMIDGYNVLCPSCYDPQPAPDNSGSHVWPTHLVQQAHTDKRQIVCHCGTKFRVSLTKSRANS